MSDRIGEACWYEYSNDKFYRGILRAWGSDGTRHRNSGGLGGVVEDAKTGQCFGIPVSSIWFSGESPEEVDEDEEHEE